jgi:prepilin-type processing-associated H-X9-DG protein
MAFYGLTRLMAFPLDSNLCGLRPASDGHKESMSPQKPQTKRSQRSRIRSGHRAFTLAELLAVISVTSLLAATLFPLLGRARENARKASCTSNLQQIGRAWTQYARDYDQKTLRFSTSRPGKIFYWWGSFDGTTLKTSEGLLRPYLKSPQVLECPAFKDDSRAVVGATGYAYNNWYLSPTSYGPAPAYAEIPRAIGIAQIKTPSETVVMADSARLSIDDKNLKLESNTYLSTPRYAYPTLHGRHDAWANVLWADGHVNAVKPTFRSGAFGYEGDGPYHGEDFQRQNLGDLDRDGNFQTNELFDLE